MAITKLHQVAQHVEDMDRAVAFYRDVLEIPLIARFDPPGLAFFDLGSCRLLLENGAPESMIYLSVPDVRAEIERLEAAGVRIVGEPHAIHHDKSGVFGAAGEAEELAFFRDSEGNLVALAGRRRVDD